MLQDADGVVAAERLAEPVALAMAIRTRRTLVLTQAPIFKSFDRIVPTVALASPVSASAAR